MLSTNPFAVLGASPRDSRQRLEELAAEEDDPALHEHRQLAVRALSIPKKRLNAELRWLPGVSPARARALLSLARTGTHGDQDLGQLPPIALANLAAERIHAIVADTTTGHSDLVFPLLVDLGFRVDAVEGQSLQQLVNEDRAIAGVPAIADLGVLEHEIEHWRQDLVQSICDTLRLVPRPEQIALLEATISEATKDGEQHGPLTCHEIVDALEIDWVSHLEALRDLVFYEISILRAMGRRGLPETALLAQVPFVAAALKNWDEVAQPFQLSASARGREHEHSANLARDVRGAAVDIANEHDFLVLADSLTKTLHGFVIELRGTAARLEQDAVAISDLKAQRKQREHSRKEWEEKIHFEAEIGFLVHDRIGVSSQGVRKNTTVIPLDEVHGIRWGGTQHSVNGIPTGTTYTIGVSSTNKSITIETRREAVYDGFTAALRHAVMSRLMFQLTQLLKNGERIAIGGIVFDDDGAHLRKSKLFAADETRHFGWTDVRFHSASGMLVLSSAGKAEYRAAASYQDHFNTHLLATFLRILSDSEESCISDAMES